MEVVEELVAAEAGRADFFVGETEADLALDGAAAGLLGELDSGTEREYWGRSSLFLSVTLLS